MKAAVLLSGGLDSATCLAKAVKKYGASEVVALSIFYGQKHDKEIRAAEKIAEYYKVPLHKLNLADVFKGSTCSLLINSAQIIPEGSYAEQQKHTPGKPVSTYVPFRNGLMLAVAASMALSMSKPEDTPIEIYYGAHKDDAAGNAYPDCSWAFVHTMNEAILKGTDGQVCLRAPFAHYTKAGIVEEGMKLKVPYELTWSCYNGKQKACGKCGTCIDRKAAFEENGLEDPIEYEN